MPFDGLYQPPDHAQVEVRTVRDGREQFAATVVGRRADHVATIEAELTADRWPVVTVEHTDYPPQVTNWTAQRTAETMVIYLYQSETAPAGRRTVTYHGKDAH